jgi:hypothetical protein
MSHYEFLSLLIFCLTLITIYSISQDKEKIAKKALNIISKISDINKPKGTLPDNESK